MGQDYVLVCEFTKRLELFTEFFFRAKMISNGNLCALVFLLTSLLGEALLFGLGKVFETFGNFKELGARLELDVALDELHRSAIEAEHVLLCLQAREDTRAKTEHLLLRCTSGRELIVMNAKQEEQRTTAQVHVLILKESQTNASNKV
jgi:hypothetical protein